MPASYCPSCGNPVEHGVSYCPNCGAAIPGSSTAQTFSGMQTGQATGYVQVGPGTGLDQPLSVGQYVVMMLLSGIPLVGLILMFVWAFGSDINTNKKNYARAFLIISAIGIAVSIFLSSILAATFATIFRSVRSY